MGFATCYLCTKFLKKIVHLLNTIYTYIYIIILLILSELGNLFHSFFSLFNEAPLKKFWNSSFKMLGNIQNIIKGCNLKVRKFISFFLFSFFSRSNKPSRFTFWNLEIPPLLLPSWCLWFFDQTPPLDRCFPRVRCVVHFHNFAYAF